MLRFAVESTLVFEMGPDFTLYYPRLRVAYNVIPKNACSTLKASLAYAEDGSEFEIAPHELDERFQAPPEEFTSSWRRVVAVRDPYERLVSAYMDKIIRPATGYIRKMVAQIYSELGRPAPVGDESVSLTEFFRWFSRQPLHQTDAHWRPQASLLAFSQYEHVLRVESLSADWCANGLDRLAPLRHYHAHATRSTSPLPLDAPLIDMPGHYIYGYVTTTGAFPPRACFDVPAFKEEVRAYYRDDYELFDRLTAQQRCIRPAAARTIRPRTDLGVVIAPEPRAALRPARVPQLA